MADVSAGDSQPVYIDLSYLREISGNDGIFIKDMIQTYLDHTPGYIEKLKLFLADQKWDEIGHLAHKMKPSIGFMGIHMLKETIQQLQDNGLEAKNTSEIPSLIKKIEDINDFALSELREIIK